jgi:hypothetical protein
MTAEVKELVLKKLFLIENLSKGRASEFLEACVVCLHESKHQPGVILTVNYQHAETQEYKFQINGWGKVTKKLLASWADMEETVEYAASGFACLLIEELTDFTLLERSRKGTGFDYWLKYKDDPLFQSKARMEISGILKGSLSNLNNRVKIKLAQVKKSAELNLPAYVVVVEFSNFVVQVVRDDGRS